MPRRVQIGEEVWEISDREKTTIVQVSQNPYAPGAEGVRTEYTFSPLRNIVQIVTSKLDPNGGPDVIKECRYESARNYWLEDQEAPRAWRALTKPPLGSPPKGFYPPPKLSREEPMSIGKADLESLHGVRVSITDPDRKGGRLAGTILDAKENPDRRSLIVVHLDKHDRRFTRKIAGISPGFGGVFYRHSASFANVDVQHRKQNYVGTPASLGVVATESFMQDEVLFEKGSTGFVVERHWGQNILDTQYWTVSWHNVRNSWFGIRPGAEEGVGIRHCWDISNDKPLSWCTLDPGDWRVRYRFPGFRAKPMGPKFKEGDYVIYQSDKPQHLNVNNTVYALTQGTVLEITAGGDGYSLRASVAGGCGPEVLGYPLALKSNAVKALEASYFRLEARVKVVAEVHFKKRSLQGLTGVVLLPTDQDGDVGVEFGEDIGAGSLDGIGKEGRCLYIPASALKKVSE